MMLISEPNAVFSLTAGITGCSADKSIKTYGEAQNFFAAVDLKLDLSTIMYEVYRTINTESGSKPDLMWGLTVLYPITVNNEFNMTRGHFHQDDTKSEVYYGVEGEGLLLLMDKKGTTWAEKVFPGSVHLIDGQHGHRLVNTSGNQALKVIACWSKHAGYDYQYVEEHPFGFRIFAGIDGLDIRRNVVL
ncbi:Glucose-6-phosphate isomerase [bioreactor metagenome]|uniref:glucose-6-phosphate isomerase n=1 Tax=bioreactor metagenome TaxID=1076179 RepID=A0A645D379_9ZZZZ|nr:glucose-6-phosphate isomerase family protein [Erysipelotrichaceae bacterium]